MIKKTNGQISWLEFDILSDIPKLKHGVFLKPGGHSLGKFEGLNSSYLVGDEAEKVEQNLKLIFGHLQQETNFKKAIYARGCHGTYVHTVYEYSDLEVPSCDGLLTNLPGQVLLMKHADCQIALFYDPTNQCIANVHAGWRGFVAGIYPKTVELMRQKFNSNPANLLVAISPSLGPEHAEFINYKSEFPEEYWQFQVKPTYFDLWSASEYQLQKCGILPHHIEIAKICTYDNPKDFYSYRRSQVTGRHTTFISI